MSVLFAFLHHLAAFALVSVLVLELSLLKGELNTQLARRLRVVDAIYGASAGLLLVLGLVRVFFFEKGAAYYFHSAPFIAKLALFVAVGLLSIVPTVEFARWGKLLRQGQVPGLSPEKLRRLRLVIHLELAGIVLILLCAAMMARGAGYFG